MPRLPPKPRDELSPEQQVLHDTFHEVATNNFGPSGKLFKWEESNGAQLGPMPFLLSNPGGGTGAFQVLGALGKMPVPPDARETAILTVGVENQAGYIVYSHTAIAAAAGYLSEGQLQSIKDGKKPDGLSEKCSVAYDVAKRLSSTPGPMPNELWQKALAVLGKDETVGLLHYIGFYSYTSMFMNGTDVLVPDENT